MKSDIKKLYRKDPKLATQVAKALGMKIKVKAVNKQAIKKVALVPLNEASKIILNVMNTLEDQMGDLPSNIDKLGLKTLGSLKNLRLALQKL